VLIEAMTYRVSHHSSSDDSTRYRSADEIREAQQIDPIERMRNHLEDKGWWTQAEDEALIKQTRKDVLDAMAVAEKRAPVPRAELFNDVYDKLPKHLQEQEASFYRNLDKNKDKYPAQ
jgi:2-oxoisovalerate dehydrogenase E1 component alpha subunit